MDITLTSEDGALDLLSDGILRTSFGGRTRKATRKNLKIVLVNLFALWSDDPSLSLGVSMSNSGYRARSRYNPMSVSNQIIEVVEGLAEGGYLYGSMGFNDPRTGIGRNSRFWPSALLERLLRQAQEQGAAIRHDVGTEVIILRNTKGETVEYDDTPRTGEMRSRLKAYNARLHKTFIDIRELDEPLITLPGGGRMRIDQSDKLVRRVFNRSSWDKGGRFFGGWWQRCPKLWRAKIFLDDQPTVEDDYSGLHIVMLYAQLGIDYWASVGPLDDPYLIEGPLDFLGNPQQRRTYSKRLLLMAINAESDSAAFQAFRSDARRSNDVTASHFRNEQLSVVLAALRMKHSPIAHFFGAGLGIDLMNKDARITEEIIQAFVETNRPILTIHDSYIVRVGDDQRLNDVLIAAFASVTGVSNVQLKRVGIGFGDTLADSSKTIDALTLMNQTRSPGYLERLARFQSTYPNVH